MFHEGIDLKKLFGEFSVPRGFPDNFTGFAGTGRSLIGKPRKSRQVIAGTSLPTKFSDADLAKEALLQQRKRDTGLDAAGIPLDFLGE